MRTHYDNLQVSRNASERVIRAAYKSLAQEWHPDKHPEDRERAEKYLKIINRAFQMLSDPQKRKEHNDWIDSQTNSVSSEDIDQGLKTDSSSEASRDASKTESNIEQTGSAREETKERVRHRIRDRFEIRSNELLVLDWFNDRLVPGIVFFPFIFAWFTLQKKHSNVARVISFTWMGLFLWFMASGL